MSWPQQYPYQQPMAQMPQPFQRRRLDFVDGTGTVTLPFCVSVAGDSCHAVTVTLVNTGAAATIEGVSLVVRPA